MWTEATFPCHPSSVPAARAFVDGALRGWGLRRMAEVATLLTSELATNAVVHARTGFQVTAAYRPPELVVEVHDAAGAGPTPSVRAAPNDRYADTGRGLLLVRLLSARWGVSPTASGNAVWFALDDG